MVSSTRNISVFIACALVLLLPFKLYAAWSYLPDFLADIFPSKPAVSSPASATTEQQPVSPLVPGARENMQAPAAAGNSAVIAAGEAVPLKLEASGTREAAPFSPTLKIRSQLLTVDSEWQGAVYVDGGITIGPAATLTINPGTVVRFAKGSGLHVLGRIVIKGTRANPVRLASVYLESQDSDWSGIFLSGTEKRNVFENVAIEGAEVAVLARFSSFSADFVAISASAVGLNLQNSTASITNSVFAVPVTAITAVRSELYLEKCSISGGQSGVLVNSSAVEARDMSIKSCRLTAFSATASQLKLEKMLVTACQSALHLSRCDGSVSGSTFSNNLETGVAMDGSNLRFTGNSLQGNRIGIQLDDSLPSLWANTIAGNSSYNIMYLGEGPFFAGGNNFGGKTAAEIEDKVFSKRPGSLRIAPFFNAEPVMNDSSPGVSH